MCSTRTRCSSSQPWRRSQVAGYGMKRPPSRRHCSHAQAACTASTIRSVRPSSGSSFAQAFCASPFATRFGQVFQNRSKPSCCRRLSADSGAFTVASGAACPAREGSVDGSSDGSMTVWRTPVSGCPPSDVLLPCSECPVACSGCPVAHSAIVSGCTAPMSGCPVLPSDSRYRSVCRPPPAPGRCSIPIKPRAARSEQTRRRWRTERPHMRATRSWLGQQMPWSSACSARASRTSFGVAGRSSDQAHVDARSATRRADPRLPR